MQNCTILIPTFNRSRYLKPLLEYIVNNKYNMPILISDGSNIQSEIDSNKIIINKLNKDYSNLITHIIDDSFFMERLNASIKKVDTKYCKINMDDDFFSKEFIDEAVIELDNNKDYSIITGYNLGYNKNRTNLKNLKYWTGDKEINMQSEILKRFEYSKINWHPFGVFRKSLHEIILKDHVNICKNINSESNFNQAMLFRIYSYIMKLHSLIQGKVKFLNRCMNLTIYHEDNWGKKHALVNPLDTFYDKFFLNFLNEIKNILSQSYDMEKIFINKLLHYVILNDKHIPKNLTVKTNFQTKIYNLSLKKIFNFVTNKIKFIYSNSFFISEDGKKIINYLNKQKSNEYL